jgi:hypothetical protein
MAVDFTTILTSLRMMLEAGNGDNLEIPATRFDGDLYATLELDEQSRRALVSPRIEARITRVTPFPSSPLEEYPLVRYEIGIEILVVRHGNDAHKLVNATRDDIKALAVQDADVICQALEYKWAQATDLVSNRLTYVSSDIGDFELTDDGSGLISTVHSFTGIAQAAA